MQTWGWHGRVASSTLMHNHIPMCLSYLRPSDLINRPMIYLALSAWLQADKALYKRPVPQPKVVLLQDRGIIVLHKTVKPNA